MKYYQASRRLLGVATISEEWKRWLRGKLVSDNTICFEISFESMPGYHFPETNISYFGLWRQKEVVAEFELGKLVRVPTAHDWETHLRPLMMALRNYTPMNIIDQ